MKLLIAICDNRERVHTDFMMSLTSAVLHLKDSRPDVGCHITRGSTKLGELDRSLAVITSYNIGADGIIFLEPNLLFPPDTFTRLLSWEKDIVGANTSLDRYPFTPRAQICEKTWLAPSKYERPLVSVYRMGLTCCYINKVVFEYIKEQPFFRSEWDPHTKEWIFDDHAFCDRVRGAFELFVDTKLSRDIQVFGSLPIPYDEPGASIKVMEGGA